MHCDHDMRHGNQPPAHLRQCDHGKHSLLKVPHVARRHCR